MSASTSSRTRLLVVPLLLLLPTSSPAAAIGVVISIDVDVAVAVADADADADVDVDAIAIAVAVLSALCNTDRSVCSIWCWSNSWPRRRRRALFFYLNTLVVPSPSTTSILKLGLVATDNTLPYDQDPEDLRTNTHSCRDTVSRQRPGGQD